MIKISSNGISFTVESNLHRREEPVELTSLEEPIVKSILEVVYKRIDPSLVHLERRSDNYLSIVAFDLDDFCRIKVGSRAKWISLALGYDDRKMYINDPIFSAQKNKKQRHWKIALTSDISIDDIHVYIEKSVENSIIFHNS